MTIRGHLSDCEGTGNSSTKRMRRKKAGSMFFTMLVIRITTPARNRQQHDCQSLTKDRLSNRHIAQGPKQDQSRRTREFLEVVEQQRYVHVSVTVRARARLSACTEQALSI